MDIKKWILVVALCAIAFATVTGISMALSTNTVTVTPVPGNADMKVVRVTWHDNDTLNTGTNQAVDLNGYIIQVVTIPHVNSTIQPDDNYDVYIYHGNSTTASLLGTTLENRDEANTEIVIPSVPPFATTATVKHTNSTVLDATGAIDIYVSPTR